MGDLGTHDFPRHVARGQSRGTEPPPGQGVSEPLTWSVAGVECGRVSVKDGRTRASPLGRRRRPLWGSHGNCRGPAGVTRSVPPSVREPTARGRCR